MACIASPVAIRRPPVVMNVVTMPKSQAPQMVPISPPLSTRAVPQREVHSACAPRAVSPSAPSTGKNLGHYILGKTLGEGTFGKVKLGRHILTGERVAVKVLEKDRIQEVADIERVAREVQLLKLMRHPHVVQLFEIIETKGQLFLIMEYASGGELFDYIVQHHHVQEKDACYFFHQLIAGVEKIHQLNVVHRDLKPENLLLDEHKCIKIVDFGLSNRFDDHQLLKTACGSPCYAPPEMVLGQSYIPRMCDMWSCGVILFAMTCGFLPFEDSNTAALYKKIQTASYNPPNFISDSVKDLIAGLLTVDPSKRFTIADVRAHPWYRQIPEASMQPRDLVAKQCGLDEDVLEELKRHGFPRDYAISCLQNNKHNSVTTTYYLLAAKRRRMMQQLLQEEHHEERDSNRATSPVRPGASTTDQRPEAKQSVGGVAKEASRGTSRAPPQSPQAISIQGTPRAQDSRVQASTPNSSRLIVSPELVSRPCSATQAISIQGTPRAQDSRVQAPTPNSSRLIVSPELVSRPCSATQGVVPLSTSDKVRAATMYVSRRAGASTAPSTPRQPASRGTSVSPVELELERPEAKQSIGGVAKEASRGTSRVTSPRVIRDAVVSGARHPRLANTTNTRLPSRVQISRVPGPSAPGVLGAPAAPGAPTPRQVRRGVPVPTAQMAYPTAWAYGGRS